jgi:hypothetical protein
MRRWPRRNTMTHRRNAGHRFFSNGHPYVFPYPFVSVEGRTGSGGYKRAGKARIGLATT